MHPFKFSFSKTKKGPTTSPLLTLKKQIQTVLENLGLEQVEGNFISSSFFNADALLIPQNHPSRTMQDTFFLKQQDKQSFSFELDPLEEERILLENLTLWGLKPSKNKFYFPVLRTHTTTTLIEEHKKTKKTNLFCIGKIFRNENQDKTHLREFHQVEIFLQSKKANLKYAFSFLKKFYALFGFSKIKFVPAFFPYTEPSFEIYLQFEGQWLEVGGGGIFRKEIFKEGSSFPSIGIGLGLERFCLLLNPQISSLRQLYDISLI